MTLTTPSLVLDQFRRGGLPSRPASQDEAGGGPGIRQPRHGRHHHRRHLHPCDIEPHCHSWDISLQVEKLINAASEMLLRTFLTIMEIIAGTFLLSLSSSRSERLF